MSDKFVVSTNEIGRIIVTDVETGNVYHHDNLSHFLGLIRLLNELHEETQLLKCALASDAITTISLNDKKVDIPPYYEFENYQQLKKERREEYDEYW